MHTGLPGFITCREDGARKGHESSSLVSKRHLHALRRFPVTVTQFEILCPTSPSLHKVIHPLVVWKGLWALYTSVPCCLPPAAAGEKKKQTGYPT